MRKLLVLLTILVLGHWAMAQNQYPTAKKSNVRIDGGQLNMVRPVTSGGWARGINYYSDPAAARLGGIGMLGSGEAPVSLYMAHGVSPWANGNGIYVLANGNVGIGTTNPDGWKLAVNGNIRAKEIKVETGWSDFVFERGYDLPTLKEVEQHIKEKGHLKGIPSSVEVEKNGIFLGKMDAKLLQKIEELTLYVISQEKQLQYQKRQLAQSGSRLSALEARIKKLESLLTRPVTNEN